MRGLISAVPDRAERSLKGLSASINLLRAFDVPEKDLLGL